MLKLELLRDGMHPQYTHGSLYIDGVFQCYTLEDPVRRGPKQKGETAIPEGEYEIVLNNSQRFGADWPEITNVPGFTAIRIHGGNTVKDTEGCLLTGSARSGSMVTGSQAALKPLLNKIRAAKLDGIRITIKNCREPLVD